MYQTFKNSIEQPYHKILTIFRFIVLLNTIIRTMINSVSEKMKTKQAIIRPVRWILKNTLLTFVATRVTELTAGFVSVIPFRLYAIFSRQLLLLIYGCDTLGIRREETGVLSVNTAYFDMVCEYNMRDLGSYRDHQQIGHHLGKHLMYY